jgi:hypothetical protein
MKSYTTQKKAKTRGSNHEAAVWNSCYKELGTEEAISVIRRLKEHPPETVLMARQWLKHGMIIQTPELHPATLRHAELPRHAVRIVVTKHSPTSTPHSDHPYKLLRVPGHFLCSVKSTHSFKCIYLHLFHSRDSLSELQTLLGGKHRPETQKFRSRSRKLPFVFPALENKCHDSYSVYRKYKLEVINRITSWSVLTDMQHLWTRYSIGSSHSRQFNHVNRRCSKMSKCTSAITTVNHAHALKM